MTFMQWDDAFAVGLPEIDKQHQWLIHTTNLLHDELARSAPDRAFIGEVLDGLMDYTVNHFILEEELFQRCSYPGGDAHKRLHDKFSATLMGVLQDFEAGADIASGMLELMKNWLVQHILIADKAYAPFVQPAINAQSAA